MYARIMFLPLQYMQTFEEAFTIGFFKMDSTIFNPLTKDLQVRHIAYQSAVHNNPFKDLYIQADVYWSPTCPTVVMSPPCKAYQISIFMSKTSYHFDPLVWVM
ncbi:hypothetical protein GOP47_0008930 [Adiantum capillus-veneris]|uniref:Uncharacterized protein n=1 Tax=Adiantum capillus-veneris TaxID=13818 RepID=A0A9D4UZW6_ADICA|nr:hypothetical protein GOP47_0008930 [Adiantum capillus-veneris]